MKTYTVSYYNKKDNQLITREMRIKAENAKESRAKFDRAYKGAQTGMHAFGIKVHLMKEATA